MIDDVTTIQRLVRLESMMTTAYDETLGKVNDARLVETLGVLRSHHAQSVRSLQKMAPGAAEEPEFDGGFMRYVEEVLDTLDDAVRRDEAIGELRVAEAALGMTYGQALQEVQDTGLGSALKECMIAEKEHVGVLAMAHEVART